MTDVREYLQHDDGCPVDPARIETTSHDEITTARCLSCSSAFPPPDPGFVPGAESASDPVERYRVAVAAAERRLSKAGS